MKPPGSRVLVIDDDDTARLVVEAMLSKAGYRTQAISSPIGATRVIREQAIDAVVCDLNMPAMQGDALARLFRQSKTLRSVRIVLISGAPREQLDALLSDGTVDAVVHKSDLGTQLIPSLRKLLPSK